MSTERDSTAGCTINWKSKKSLKKKWARRWLQSQPENYHQYIVVTKSKVNNAYGRLSPLVSWGTGIMTVPEKRNSDRQRQAWPRDNRFSPSREAWVTMFLLSKLALGSKKQKNDRSKMFGFPLSCLSWWLRRTKKVPSNAGTDFRNSRRNGRENPQAHFT